MALSIAAKPVDIKVPQRHHEFKVGKSARNIWADKAAQLKKAEELKRKAELRRKALEAKQAEERRKARAEAEQKRLETNSVKTYSVSAYTSGYESTQKHVGDPGYGVTASGTKAMEGRTAACPPDIPFGSIVQIEGLGERVCEDRGGAITSRHVDVYFDDVVDATRFGRQDLEVKIK